MKNKNTRNYERNEAKVKAKRETCLRKQRRKMKYES